MKTKINLPHKTMQLKLKLQPFPIIASHRLMNKTFLVRLSLRCFLIILLPLKSSHKSFTRISIFTRRRAKSTIHSSEAQHRKFQQKAPEACEYAT